MEQILHQILDKVTQLDQKFQEMDLQFATVNKKLDMIQKQVVINTEEFAKVSELSQRVLELEVDVKIIKKAMTLT